ncbi:hypothetical protein CHS0354_016688 [Potamilus streckersoni]|uniref:Uncharacterized protein n=1 Tax=Potamilus streckersoni TaxID=2493646 RepID=A0AAE0WDS3_9BIVA|nr:hypothetical protein CHS0354_016688 [Potamilus streckersoni]
MQKVNKKDAPQKGKLIKVPLNPMYTPKLSSYPSSSLMPSSNQTSTILSKILPISSSSSPDITSSSSVSTNLTPEKHNQPTQPIAAFENWLFKPSKEDHCTGIFSEKLLLSSLAQPIEQVSITEPANPFKTPVKGTRVVKDWLENYVTNEEPEPHPPPIAPPSLKEHSTQTSPIQPEKVSSAVPGQSRLGPLSDAGNQPYVEVTPKSPLQPGMVPSPVLSSSRQESNTQPIVVLKRLPSKRKLEI